MAEGAETIASDDRRGGPKPSAHDQCSWTLLSSGTPSGKDKMDDEIKLAGLEALVPEEFEKLNSNRLRTFEDAGVEIVTYVGAKFGLRIRDSKPSDTVLREHSRPHGCWSGQLSLVGQRKSVIIFVRWVFSSAVEHIFNETATQARTQASNRLAKGNQSKSWSKSESSITGKGTRKENNGLSKGTKSATTGSKGAKGSGKGKSSKTGISRLEHLKPETCLETQES